MWWTLGFEPPTSRLIAHSFLFKFRGYGLKQGGWGASSKGDLTFITLNASYLNQIFMILIWGDDRQNVGGLPPEELRGLINRRWGAPEMWFRSAPGRKNLLRLRPPRKEGLLDALKPPAEINLDACCVLT